MRLPDNESELESPDLTPVIDVVFLLLIFFLVASALGWKTRISLFGATLLYVYINMCDSVSTITKYSVKIGRAHV